MPLISVVIPTHNRPDMLAEALASVRAQTFRDYEIVIVSNGESAEMRARGREVVADHYCRYAANFVRHLELKDGNLSAARNHGIEQARGDWIAFLDDDDLWLPHKLERQVAEAMRTGADLIACRYIEVYRDGREIERKAILIEGWSYARAFSHQYYWIQPSTALVARHALDAVGGFDAKMRICEDNDLWRRLSWHHSIHQMDEVLVRYRQGHASMMQNKRACYGYDLLHFKKMHRDTPSDLRSTLPSFRTFVIPRLIAIYGPNWLLAVFRVLRPRYRWIRFRQLLRPRSRIRDLRYRLRLRTRINELRYRLRLRTRWNHFRKQLGHRAWRVW